MLLRLPSDSLASARRKGGERWAVAAELEFAGAGSMWWIGCW